MKRQDSHNILSGPAVLEVQPGQYAAYMVRVVGTNQAAQTLTAANLGLLTAKVKGRPFYSVTFAVTQTMNDIDFGQVESASAVGAAFTFSALIPATYVGDGNIFDVVGDDDVTVELDLSGVTGVIVASGTVQLFAVPKEGTQLYLPQTFGVQPTIAASSIDDHPLKFDNISAVYIVTTTNLDRVMLSKDGRAEVDATVGDLQALSNLENRHEAAFTAGFKMDLARSSSIGESLSDRVDLSLTTTAGGAFSGTVVSVSHAFTPAEFARSAALAQALTRERVQKKVGQGKNSEARVIQNIGA